MAWSSRVYKGWQGTLDLVQIKLYDIYSTNRGTSVIGVIEQKGKWVVKSHDDPQIQLSSDTIVVLVTTDGGVIKVAKNVFNPSLK